ncbi:MAG TPA: hypothetical protein VHF47_09710 [Acidimicrobiales bacterium]|nr:hypothetical protein [Acidimicrobiales bacterium]
MRAPLVDELEEFVRRGGLWDRGELDGLVTRLERESDETGDPIPRLLAHPLRALLVRLGMGEVPRRMANDVEGILYPRIWKVMEAARDGLPDGELRTRIEVLNRRLSRRLVEERPG